MSQQINLFNPIFLQQKKIFSARTMALALGVLFAGTALLNTYGNWRVSTLRKAADAGALQLQQRQARLASVTAEFPPRVKSAAVDAELQDAEGQLAALRQVSGVLERGELGNTNGYAEYFRALARQHVDGLWLTGVSVGGAGRDIGVRGRALDPERVPGFLNRLTREPVLQGKAFGSLQISQGAPLSRVDSAGRTGTVPAPWVEFSLLSTMEVAKP